MEDNFGLHSEPFSAVSIVWTIAAAILCGTILGLFAHILVELL